MKRSTWICIPALITLIAAGKAVNAQATLVGRQSNLDASYLIGAGGDGKSGGGSDSETALDQRLSIAITGVDSHDSRFNGAIVHTSVFYDIRHQFQADGSPGNVNHIASTGSTQINTFAEPGGLSNLNDGNRLELQFTVASETNFSLLATVTDSFTGVPHATIVLQQPGIPRTWVSLFPTIAADTTEQHTGVLPAGLYRIVANADAPGRTDGDNSSSWNFDLTLTSAGAVSAPEPPPLTLMACLGVLAGWVRRGVTSRPRSRGRRTAG